MFSLFYSAALLVPPCCRPLLSQYERSQPRPSRVSPAVTDKVSCWHPQASWSSCCSGQGSHAQAGTLMPAACHSPGRACLRTVPSQPVHAGTCHWDSDCPQPAGPLTFWGILAPHVASVAEGLQELEDVGEVQLPRAVGLVPPWHLCNLDMT